MLFTITLVAAIALVVIVVVRIVLPRMSHFIVEVSFVLHLHELSLNDNF